MASVDVWLCAGQSNMAGRGLASQSPVPDPALAWQYDDGDFVPLADPVGSEPYDARTGSMVPLFAKAYTTVSERPSAFVPCAVGGSALLAENATSDGDWTSPGSRYDDAVGRTLDACTALERRGHDVEGVNVLWHQGERDAQGGSALEGYQSAYANLVDRFRTSLRRPRLKVYALRIGLGDPETEGWQTVRDAQTTAAETTPGMELAYSGCVDFFTLGWMQADGLHYTQLGLNDMGVNTAAFVAEDQGYPPLPLPEHRRSRIARER